MFRFKADIVQHCFDARPFIERGPESAKVDEKRGCLRVCDYRVYASNKAALKRDLNREGTLKLGTI